MYQYNANGQKIPVQAQVKIPLPASRENYINAKSALGDSKGSSSSKRNTVIWIILAVVVVVVLIGLFLWLRNKGSSSTVSMGMCGSTHRFGSQRFGFRFY